MNLHVLINNSSIISLYFNCLFMIEISYLLIILFINILVLNIEHHALWGVIKWVDGGHATPTFKIYKLFNSL